MARPEKLAPVWDDLDRTLIEDHHVGSLLLTAKNLKSAEETTKLCYELQKIAHDAGHPVPLAIGIDQENGGVNSLFDEIYIRQYPSTMGMAATGSTDLAFEVAKSTAQEIAACGINWIFGPCLDVLTNARNQPLGVRTAGDDPQEVSAFGCAFMQGYKEAGVVTLGKHFPSYGNLEFLGSTLDVPIITESLEQLSLSALVPFKKAIERGLDSMMVGGCAMSSAGLNAMHACLSEQVVDELLRKDLKFDGVVVSECLEMDALSHNIGVGGGTVMAVNAGCDVVLLCRSFSLQQEGLKGLKTGIESEMVSRDRIFNSLRRVLEMKKKCTSWEKALNPPGISYLDTLQPSHTALSTKAYNSSITVPLAASAASRALSDAASGAASHSPEPAAWERSSSVMSGERVFRELGRSLARQRNGRVLHTSYTANGVRPVHENLINRASAIIVLTADANRNLYQSGFTKHVSMICNMQYTTGGERREKPLIVVAVSSPYDFAMDTSIGTYICTYDFTETALNSLVRVLYGELTPTGTLPGTISKSQKLHPSRQHWLVEIFNEDRDANALDNLIAAVVASTIPSQRSELSSATSNSFVLHHTEVEESHFVVRNSSTQALYGFVATYFFKSTGTGVIAALFVDPARRKLSIGHSLHNRAIRTLLQKEGIKRFQLGSRLPSVYLGIPTGHGNERKRLRSWFAGLGWGAALSRPVCNMVARNLQSWNPPDGMAKSLASAGAQFDLVYGWDYAGPILDHIKTSNRQGLAEVYKLALSDPSACGIIRAKRPEDGALVGTVVLYNHHSRLSDYIPPLKDLNEAAGGISSPVISPSVGEYSTLLQGLILLGMRQIKQQGCNACLLDYMDGDGNFDGFSAMGFDVMHNFEEVSCDAATWTMIPPA
ncbi:similar to beta-N-acetylglucosaminidase [Plenodomus lingam JN3]|uniref:Similar to beta-N-acetylglucosaminidase n=1 Tax=Leptosphaeria maculans (strain JN3 / isolate v23.1.3 / race Av1-4-5-6-7-8) TaxID=985895 RepID=E5A892_LEPMJ|nr:similar to beta-N-acetylglucosaminidase [Plenodomus lingam JN3]CBX99837.1 similar to beta-N-acetylglucosaminidase [Plenodomus lingam JN3]